MSDEQNRMITKQESNLLITRHSMITDWIGRHDVLLQSNHNKYTFLQK